MSKSTNRRSFIRKLATGVAGAAVAPVVAGASSQPEHRIESLNRFVKTGAADTIRLGLIGAGGMGLADANTAITVPGVKLVAACDLYDGRLADAKKYMATIFSPPAIIGKLFSVKILMPLS